MQRGLGDTEAIKAQDAIEKVLADENATGSIFENDNPGSEIFAFPGVNVPLPMFYGPFKEEGSLDGILIGVGGAECTAHLQPRKGETKYNGIVASRESAHKLAKHLYGQVQLFGICRWLGEEEGNWVLKKFRIQD